MSWFGNVLVWMGFRAKYGWILEDRLDTDIATVYSKPPVRIAQAVRALDPNILLTVGIRWLRVQPMAFTRLLTTTSSADVAPETTLREPRGYVIRNPKVGYQYHPLPPKKSLNPKKKFNSILEGFSLVVICRLCRTPSNLYFLVDTKTQMWQSWDFTRNLP